MGNRPDFDGGVRWNTAVGQLAVSTDVRTLAAAILRQMIGQENMDDYVLIGVIASLRIPALFNLPIEGVITSCDQSSAGVTPPKK